MVTDKNGKELYCGDLVRYNSDSEVFCEGDDKLIWVIIGMKEFEDEFFLKSGRDERTAYSYEIEKIEDENE